MNTLKSTYQDALASYGIGGAHPGGLHLTKQIFQKENILENTTILDAGCGTGQTAAYLAKQYKCQVTAIDHHPLMVEKAKERFLNEKLSIPVVKGSIEDLPFPTHSFDFVLAESVTAFTQTSRTIKEYYRILKPNGILIDLDMTSEVPLNEEEKYNICRVYGMENVFTESEWIDQFIASGFHSVQVPTGSSIFSHMQEPQPPQQPEFHLSPHVTPELVEILIEHNEITNLYAHKIGFRLFRALKA